MSAESTLRHGLRVQLRVIGALILRELHTRYGRENIGYLWLIAEPMLLAGSVSLIHLGDPHHRGGILPVPFALGGYCVFIIFRSIITRAEGALHANQPLLYHRMVTIFDMLAARAVLETASSTAALFLLLAGACALGVAEPPARPLVLLAALALMSWFSFALSMMVCAATYVSKMAHRLIHPVVYLAMPMSGAFFLLKWIPEPYRGWLSWVPLTQIFELLRIGQFESFDSPYVDPAYLVAWCLALTLAGLACLRIVRRHIHL
ncbi:ABC transporter permease [Cupriavidus sp. USMAA2-4]|uniref:ABC transporter permease n=1 Tax=Cupriavidus sp. USMAA2-4 TaxID=876364 RepID=UPI000A0769CD|nr:ABC transporter permease [Cupriavidus sp. USMAA2-4]